MTVSNYLNQYFKLQSPEIDALIQDLSDYDSLEIKGYINCCTCAEDYKQTLELGLNSWFIDLTAGVIVGDFIKQINIQSVYNGLTYNILGEDTIDLGYVQDNCMSSPCTIQTFNSYFSPLIKTTIDSYLEGIGISSNVTVTTSGNKIQIANLPNGFILSTIVYGAEDVDINTTSPFSYGDVDAENTTIFIYNDGIYISPSLFEQLTMQDGVYKFTVKITKDEVVTEISNCAFIDVETKCKVATLLHLIIKENESPSNPEKIATIAHILHYALVNGSNCGCNCEELCKVYAELYKLITNIDPQILGDCGC